MIKPLARKWNEKKIMTILAYSIVVKWYHHVIVSADQIQTEKKNPIEFMEMWVLWHQVQQMLAIFI